MTFTFIIQCLGINLLNFFFSPLQSKATFISEFKFLLWRALSCQQTPSQAINPTRKITKEEENYKIMIRQTKLSLSNSPKTLSSLVLGLLLAELNNLLLDLLV